MTNGKIIIKSGLYFHLTEIRQLMFDLMDFSKEEKKDICLCRLEKSTLILFYYKKKYFHLRKFGNCDDTKCIARSSLVYFYQ
jgi:hypothetical protein